MGCGTTRCEMDVTPLGIILATLVGGIRSGATALRATPEWFRATSVLTGTTALDIITATSVLTGTTVRDIITATSVLTGTTVRDIITATSVLTGTTVRDTITATSVLTGTTALDIITAAIAGRRIQGRDAYQARGLTWGCGSPPRL